VLIDLGQSDHLGAVLTLDAEGKDDFFDYSRCTSNFDVFVAHRTVFVQNEPILDTLFAEKSITVITLFGISAQLEANLTQQHICKRFIYFKNGDRVRVVAKFR
jgi:hypothetical protein